MQEAKVILDSAGSVTKLQQLIQQQVDEGTAAGFEIVSGSISLTANPGHFYIAGLVMVKGPTPKPKPERKPSTKKAASAAFMGTSPSVDSRREELGFSAVPEPKPKRKPTAKKAAARFDINGRLTHDPLPVTPRPSNINSRNSSAGGVLPASGAGVEPKKDKKTK